MSNLTRLLAATVVVAATTAVASAQPAGKPAMAPPSGPSMPPPAPPPPEARDPLLLVRDDRLVDAELPPKKVCPPPN